MNSKILIIEGTSGVGKSYLADALLRRYFSENKKIRSLLHLTQAHTYGPLAIHEDKGLTKEMNKWHLERIYIGLQWFSSSIANEHKAKFFGLIDTLHLTHCVRPGIINWDDVSAFDIRLNQIECKLVFIKAEPATIWDRGIVPRLHEQFIIEYAKKFGDTPEEIYQYFTNEQRKLEVLADRSSLEKIILNAELDFQLNLEKAYHFWLQ